MHKPAKFVSSACFVQPDHLRSLMQFRLGGHKLQVVTGRWANKSRVSGGRVCKWCVPWQVAVEDGHEGNLLVDGWVEDEKHVLLACPRCTCVRQRFANLLSQHGRRQQPRVLLYTCVI